MRAFTAAVAACAGLLLGGCAVAPHVPYPEYGTPHVSVSSAPLNEAYPAEAIISGSQVAVGGATAGQRVGSGFGLLGWAIGNAVDQARNRASAIEVQDRLTLRFHEVVASELAAAPAAGTRNRGFLVLPPDNTHAHVFLTPMARLIADSPTEVRAIYQLEAQFSAGPESRERDRVHTYRHVALSARPFTNGRDGWADQDGAVFREASEAAFRRLARVVAADLRGDGLSRDVTGKPRVRWLVEDRIFGEGWVMRDDGDHLVVLPMAGGERPVHRMTLVAPKAVTFP